MAPCKTEQSVTSVLQSSKAQAALQLNTMRKAIPKEAFEKNVFRYILIKTIMITNIIDMLTIFLMFNAYLLLYAYD